MKSGIYAIRNIVNGKFYIGQASNFIQRKRQHWSDLNLNKHRNSYLQNAWNKYWSVNFQFLIIEYCKIEQLEKREDYWIKITNCCNRDIGYNRNPSSLSSYGIKRSEESKKRMSLAKKGKSIHTEKSKEKLRQFVTGRKHSAESIAKMKIVQSGERKRKFDKWPCIDGIKCKCRECKNKINFYIKNRRDKNKQQSQWTQ